MSKLKSIFYKYRSLWALLGVLSVVILLQLVGVLSPWGGVLYDSLFISRPAKESISIIAIDENSLGEIGAWPWNREVFAKLITKLDQSGVKVAVFDVTFFEAREGDSEMLTALRSTDLQVVLAGKLEDGGLLQPIGEYLAEDNVTSGFATFREDLDEKVRVADLTARLESGEVIPSLAFAGLLKYFDHDLPESFPMQLGFTEIPSNRTMINYNGPVGSFSKVGVGELLNNESTSLEYLDGDIVFIGSTVQDLKFGLDDNFVTPLGSMPGVEIHANVADMLIQNKILTPLPSGLAVLLTIIYTFLALWIAIGLTRLRFVALSFGLLTFSHILLSLVLFSSGIVVDLLFFLVLLAGYWLAISVLKYLAKRNESQEVRRAFSQYVNADLLARILQDPEQLRLGGTRKNLTIMFSDIRGFTGLSERMDPEELVLFLNDYLTQATNKIYDTQGMVDKYLGDAIMALWNAPLADPSHALHACLAAKEIVKVLGSFNTTRPDLPDLAIGIGINTGEVVVGNMGSESRFDYTAMGDEVNLASRLEGLTKKYGVSIILGEGVIRELKTGNQDTNLLYRKLDRVRVKGKQKPIDIFEFVLAENADQLIKDYEEALGLYLAGQFTAAAEKFSMLSQDDYPSQVMLGRCRNLSGSDWLGYWVWDEK